MNYEVISNTTGRTQFVGSKQECQDYLQYVFLVENFTVRKIQEDASKNIS